MGNPRPRPALLHQKFVAIREYLDVGQQVLAVWLKLPHAGRVSEYECNLREPSLKTLLEYSRLGKVSMESLVDDQVSLDEFRKQLGTLQPESETKPTIQSKQQRPKPVILIHGHR
jgi:hypothetical protein